jgi:Spy/CpxP family protein refolding chaperone
MFTNKLTRLAIIQFDKLNEFNFSFSSNLFGIETPITTGGFKMKRFTQLAVIAAFVTPAISQADQAEMTVAMADSIVYAKSDAPDSCKQVKLTEEQQTSLRDAFFDFNKAKKPLRKDVKTAFKEMKNTFSSATSTREDAVASQVNTGAKVTALAKLMGDFHLKVFFDILTPEQREPAMRCMEDLK